MTVRVLSESDVACLLDPEEVVDLLAEVMITVSRGGAVLPTRTATASPDGSQRIGLMSGWLQEPCAIGLKAVSLFGSRPDNLSHAGVVLIFDVQSGQLSGVIAAARLTALRTAAASVLATRLFAKRGGRALILGTGVQAEAHARLFSSLVPCDELLIWGRDPRKAESLSERLAHDGVAAKVAPSIRDALLDASVITTTTSAPSPLIRGDELPAGIHVNLVGSSFPTTAELDAGGVARGRYFVDHRPSALLLAGELRASIELGLVTEDHILGEIGEVLAGDRPGRTDVDQITIFKSLGSAAQDLAVAKLVLDRAEEQRRGVTVEL